MLSHLPKELPRDRASMLPDNPALLQTRQQREAEFWDHKSLQDHNDGSAKDLWVNPETCMDPRRDELSYYSLTQFYCSGLRTLGDMTGKRVLDYGCGDGLLSVAAAKQGAMIDAIDISSHSIQLAHLRAQVNGVHDRIRVHVMDGQSLDFPDQSFDYVMGSFILHHVDIAMAGKEICRVLIPGGKAFFVENSAANKLLLFARNCIAGRYGTPKYGSDDESPLTAEQLNILTRCFSGQITVRHPSFVFFRLLAGYIRLCSGKRVMRMLAAIDHAVFRYAAPLRKYSYFQTIELKKEAPTKTVNTDSTVPSR